MDLSGHVAIVTGAGSGVGAATAALLFERGATVAVFGRREEPLRRAVAGFPGRSSVHVVDVSDPLQVAAAVSDVVALHGAPTLLVNAAGIDGPVALTDLTPELWNEQIAVNLSGSFFVAHSGMLSKPGRTFFGSIWVSHLMQLLPSLLKPVTTRRKVFMVPVLC